MSNKKSPSQQYKHNSSQNAFSQFAILTSGKVGKDGSAGDRPIGGIHGNPIAGTGEQIDQLVLMGGPIH